MFLKISKMFYREEVFVLPALGLETRTSVKLEVSYVYLGHALLDRDVIIFCTGICFLINPSSLLVWRTGFLFVCSFD